MELVQEARLNTHVFVIVGDNDANTLPVSEIYNNFKRFEDAIWPTKMRFYGHMRRNDLGARLVEHNNLFLYQKIGRKYKSPRMVKNKDFGSFPHQEYHFNPNGEGYRHLNALILSVLKDFAKYW